MSDQATYGIGSEPCLAEPTESLRGRRCEGDYLDWLRALHVVPSLPDRAARLAETLRKHVADGQCVEMARGILVEAGAGRPQGIAALAALLEVEGPGELLLQRVAGFHHLHRMVLRLARRGGAEPRSPEAALLLLHGELARELEGERSADLAPRGERPGVHDVGPAGPFRRRFARLEDKLRRTGQLDAPELALFLRLCRAELDARSLRASELAGSINPYLGRQVARTMPLLASMDGELRDMREFVGSLAETGRTSLFREQVPALAMFLEQHELEGLLERWKGDPESALMRRLLAGVRRHPLPNRQLAWYCDRLLRVGLRLLRSGARRQSFDLVECALLVFDHHRSGRLLVPAGDRVRRAVEKSPVEGVEFDGGEMVVRYDPAGASRLALPLGLPDPAQVEADEAVEARGKDRVPVKDLVVANINNTSVLLGLLKNAKVVSTPGVVALVVARSRNMRVLESICTTRALHSGHTNKDVPRALLTSAMPIPVKTLRKFINVRHVSKTDLRRMAKDRSSIRREVAEEIEAYLKSLQ